MQYLLWYLRYDYKNKITIPQHFTSGPDQVGLFPLHHKSCNRPPSEGQSKSKNVAESGKKTSDNEEISWMVKISWCNYIANNDLIPITSFLYFNIDNDFDILSVQQQNINVSFDSVIRANEPWIDFGEGGGNTQLLDV